MQIRVYPQDEVGSHHQELQQSVFELWDLSPRARTLWLFPMASWSSVTSPRASATVPETMGLWACARSPPEKENTVWTLVGNKSTDPYPGQRSMGPVTSRVGPPW